MDAADRAAATAARERSADTARRWREGAEYRALVQRFADCPLDRAEPAAGRAEALFADSGWAGALLAPLVAALAADPFFEPPFRFTRDTSATSAVIFDCPAVSIIASAGGARARPIPATIVFPGFVTVSRYERARGATLHRWTTVPIAPEFSAAAAPPCTALPALALADGDVHRADGRVRAHLVAGERSDMVMLVASIRSGAEPLMREYHTADGALIRAASADEAASRTEMLLTLLRHAGRADAGERFADASRDSAFHTRWAAIREWLALDARAALPRLAEMAAHDPNAEVRAAAAATLPHVRTRVACPA